MDGQSHGAMGIAKLLTGHQHERESDSRCCPYVPKDFFQLDDTSKITQLRGMGRGCGAQGTAAARAGLLYRPCEVPFHPVYELKEVQA